MLIYDYDGDDDAVTWDKENLYPLPELRTDKVVCSEVVIVDDKEGYDDDVDDVDDGKTKKKTFIHFLNSGQTNADPA